MQAEVSISGYSFSKLRATSERIPISLFVGSSFSNMNTSESVRLPSRLHRPPD